MPETLEELTYDYEDEGVLVRKQIDRAVLTKGSWATVMFLFQELDRAKGKFRPPEDGHRPVQEVQGELPQAVVVQHLEREAGAADHRGARGLVPQNRRE